MLKSSSIDFLVLSFLVFVKHDHHYHHLVQSITMIDVLMQANSKLKNDSPPMKNGIVMPPWTITIPNMDTDESLHIGICFYSR